MALTIKDKQAWLQAQGKPKSYVYFMTGPNLGGDWDWQKAVSGGYSSVELDGFFTSGESAYKAHKTKSKKSKGPQPTNGDGPSPGAAGSCATAGVKMVVTAVSKLTTLMNQIQAVVEVDDLAAVPAIRKSIKALKAQVIDELGDTSWELAALNGFDQLLGVLENAAVATQKFPVTPGIPSSYFKKLEALRSARAKVQPPSSVHYSAIDSIAGDDFTLTTKAMQAMVDDAIDQLDTALVSASDELLGAAAQQAGIEDVLLTENFEIMRDAWLGQTGATYAGFDTAANAAKAVQATLDALIEFAQPVSTTTGLSPSGIVNALGAATRKTIVEAVDAISDATIARLELMSDADFWLANNMEELQKFAELGVIELIDQVDNITVAINAIDEATGFALGPSPNHFGHQIETINSWLEEAKTGLDGALLTADELLPGPDLDDVVAVAGKLADEGFVAQVQAASTDELNTLVKTKLDELGETPSLTYFMTKKQKQDLLLLPADEFANETFYTVKYKGQFLEGGGLDTAKAKYAQKQGSAPPTKTPKKTASGVDPVTNTPVPPAPPTATETVDALTVQLDQVLMKEPSLNHLVQVEIEGVGHSWLASIAKGNTDVPQPTAEQLQGLVDLFTSKSPGAITGADLAKAWGAKIDGLADFKVAPPPGAPSWWGDPVTPKQTNFLKQGLLPKLGGEPIDIPIESLTKGQVSDLIGGIKGGEITTWEQAVAVAKGKPPPATQLADALDAAKTAAAEQVVEDVAQTAATTTPMGSVVSGSKQATSVAPDHASWDAPHTFTYKGDGQSKWGGAHRKWAFEDEDGNLWMLKHGVAEFRAEGEAAAHRLAHLAGFDIAEARVTTQTIEGRKVRGFMQRMYSDAEGEFADLGYISATDLSKLDPAKLRQIQEQQILDWFLGNHDAHSGNFLVLKDGRVVGIDKGQAFKWLGRDRLDPDYIPPGNHKTGAWTYQELWRGYRTGKIDLDLDAVDAALRRIEAVSDDEIRKALRKYADGRFSSQAGSQAFLKGTPAKNADEFIELVIERKRTIRAEFERMYRHQAGERGVEWTPKWGKDAPKKVAAAKPKVVKAGDIITPIDDEFAAALQRVGTAGRSVYVSGAEVERGQILFDIVVDTDGRQVLRVNAQLMGEADARLMKVIREEGGVAVKAASPTAASNLPPALQKFTSWNQQTLAGAKTINHHIATNDFAFNQTTLSKVTQMFSEADSRARLLAKKFGVKVTTESLDYEQVVDAGVRFWSRKLKSGPTQALVDSAAEELTEAKAFLHYREIWEAVMEQGQQGTAAVKVPMFTDFDANSTYRQFQAEFKASYLDKGDGKIVAVDEPEKVFDSIKRTSSVTSHIDLSDADGLAARYTGIGTNYGNLTYRGKIGDMEVLYRDASEAAYTHKGWLEMVIPSETGTVTAADVQRVFDTITNRLGVKTSLATPEDMELTYWRMVLGNYRSSKEATSATSKYAKAIADADSRLGALGADATPADEIEAIRGAFREQFGRVVDDADTLPIHGHVTTAEADEFGWGYFERPELGDLSSDLANTIVQHQSSYGDGVIDAAHFSDGTGHMAAALQERQRFGFKASAASASRDMETGGASSFFTTTLEATGASWDSFVINPARVARKLGNYNAPSDSFGNLARRGTNNTLSPRAWAGRRGRAGVYGGGETMIRDGAAYMDDVEIVTFSSKAARDRAVAKLRARGVNTIRGVPIEERFISQAELGGSSLGRYVSDFFRRHVDTGGRLRIGQEVFEQGRRAAAAVKKAAANLSRLKIKNGKLAKKLSAGRAKSVWFRRSDGRRQLLPVRVHATENAVSIPIGMTLDRFGNLPGLQQLKPSKTATDHQLTFGGVQRVPKFEDAALTIDLSEFGVDIKTMGKYEADRFTQELLQSLADGTVPDLAAKWNPAAAAVA